jgi:hypothetical protein
MLRLPRLAGIGLLAVLLPAAAAVAGGGDGSVVAPLRVSRGLVEIAGAGCGVPASATLALPSGVSGVDVRSPAVGARNSDARLTDVSVQGNLVTFTAVGDAAGICNGTPDARWSLSFDSHDGSLDVAFTEQVTVLFWDDDVSLTLTARPRKVPLNPLWTVRRVRWRRFGGSKAIGSGTIFGGRVRLSLSRPAHCPGQLTLPGHVEDAVFYGKVVAVPRDPRRVGFRRASKVPRCDSITRKKPTLLP